MTTTRILGKHNDRIFQSGKIYEFFDDSVENGKRLLIAHQMDQHGSHRLCLVDEEGSDIVAGYSTVYQHPCFASFGTKRFVAFSGYFDGEIVRSETVYEIECGKSWTPHQKKQGAKASVNG